MNKKADSKTAKNTAKQIKKIKKVDVDDEKGNFFFVGLIVLLIIGSLGAVLFFASNRESVLNVAPEANTDHWHYAYAIADCGEILPPEAANEAPVGIHTHGTGLIHLHPTSPEGAGPNAQLARFVESLNGELTDDSYKLGAADGTAVLSEADGCNGEPATLKLAYWEDPYDDAAEPTEVLEENLADFTFTEPAGMVTLALVADGEEIPRPSAARVACQAATDGEEYTPPDDVAYNPGSQTPCEYVPVFEALGSLTTDVGNSEGAETTVAADETTGDSETTEAGSDSSETTAAGSESAETTAADQE